MNKNAKMSFATTHSCISISVNQLSERGNRGQIKKQTYILLHCSTYKIHQLNCARLLDIVTMFQHSFLPTTSERSSCYAKLCHSELLAERCTENSLFANSAPNKAAGKQNQNHKHFLFIPVMPGSTRAGEASETCLLHKHGF